MKKNEIYYSENEVMNSQNTKDKHSEEYTYLNIFICPLNKNDCVNSMDIFDDLLVYGTIMGNVYLCRVDKNNLKSKKGNKEINEILLKVNNIDKNTEKIIKKEENNNNKEIPKIPFIKIKQLDKNIYNKNENNILSYNSNNYSNINSHDNENNKMENNKNEIKREETSKINNSIEDACDYPQITSLISNACENISCIAFDTKDNLIISVGDLEIIKLERISTFNINDKNSKYDYTRIKNYISEEDHIINCENTSCFLTSSNFLIINTIFDENNSPITMQQIPYQNKILNSLDIIKGDIEMFNFCVPFDFDGDKFLFLDYQTKHTRRICIYYTLSKKNPFIHIINNNFGHISHMKLLSNDRIFLCRKYKKCEIYKINEKFTLVEEWAHIGEEIIAVEIYIDGAKISNSINNNDIKNKFNDIFNHKSKEYLNSDTDKIQSTRRILSNNDEKEKDKEIYIKYNNKEYKHNHKKNLLVADFNKSNNSSFREFQNNNNSKWSYKKKYKEENFFSENSIKNGINNNNQEEIEIYNINKFKSKSKNKEYNTNYKSLNSDNNFLKLKTNDKDNKLNSVNNIEINYEDNLSIATLDLNGNFNLYTNKRNRVLFNLYNIPNIEQKYKDEEFFSVGFPYFITMNSLYFGISTDHGIFVISKCKK